MADKDSSSKSMTTTTNEAPPPAEPTLAGTTDTEAVKAQAKADKQAAADAEARIAPTTDQMSREEYDAIGKGPDYEPHGTPDHSFYAGTEVANAGTGTPKAAKTETKEG